MPESSSVCCGYEVAIVGVFSCGLVVPAAESTNLQVTYGVRHDVCVNRPAAAAARSEIFLDRQPGI